LSMILSENRYTLFRIMLSNGRHRAVQGRRRQRRMH
jgi:hypothetical protein